MHMKSAFLAKLSFALRISIRMRDGGYRLDKVTALAENASYLSG